MDQTNGITAYALAVDTDLSIFWRNQQHMKLLTLVFGIVHQLSHHRLDDSNVSVKKTTEYAASKSDGEVMGKAHA
jgi:hypothetical protein